MDDAADGAMPPSRLNEVPKRKTTKVIPFSPSVMRQGAFEFVKKTERVYPVLPLNAAPVPKPQSDDPFEIDIHTANTVPYTMKFISLDAGRSWHEAYKIHVEVRQFTYNELTLYMPILHRSDSDVVYGRLYDTSDRAIKSIFYKKVNAKELIDAGQSSKNMDSSSSSNATVVD